LSSTKSIGQLGRAGTRKTRTPRATNIPESQVDMPESSQGENESEIVGTKVGGMSSNLRKFSEETGSAVAGGALKSNGFPVAKRKTKKASTGQTWRERMQEARGMPNMDSNMSDDHSEYSESDSESEEYSEWSGLSDTEPGEEQLAKSVEKEPPESDHGDDEENEQNASSEVDDVQDADGNIQERAKQFTDWARQQSGFGGSAPNLSSLPQIPKKLRKPVDPTPAKIPVSSDVPKKKVLPLSS
jgi:hypothetical protein